MQRILIISFSDLSVDPRVNRQIRLLSRNYRVTAAGHGDPCLPGVEYVAIPRQGRNLVEKALAAGMLKLGLFERFYRALKPVVAARQLLGGRRFDLILANDIYTLPLALDLQSARGVVFDAHEYAPREMEDLWYWRFFFQRYIGHLCAKHIPRAAAMVTVCDGIAREYETQYGVRPAVVYNAPYMARLEPIPPAGDALRLVHHGGATPSRHIESMIEMMAYLDDRFTLDLYLMASDRAYLRRLERLAQPDPRIRFRQPVPMTELPAAVNRYDMGVYILPPVSFNNQYALPNKFFEFIQGRVGVAIGPSPEMARLVRQFECGIVAEDFSPQTLARELGKLDRDRVLRFKQRSHEAAVVLCYERAAENLERIVGEVLAGGPAPA